MSDLVHYQMLINGEWVNAGDNNRFESVNPATEQPWCTIPEATEADINRAVETAHAAFSSGEWATLTPTARGKYLRRLAELLDEK
ncbi:MAG: aldehyde dehydrogenase family protein, partial [Alphaproteobacteria bacterium]